MRLIRTHTTPHFSKSSRGRVPATPVGGDPQRFNFLRVGASSSSRDDNICTASPHLCRGFAIVAQSEDVLSWRQMRRHTELVIDRDVRCPLAGAAA